MPLESKAIVELLKLYRESPCLWDQNYFLYNCKETRRQAYEELLRKFKSCQDDATLDFVKKKIDNLRTTYKREAKKLLAARAKGNDTYRPTLWYFNLISFIDNHCDGRISPNVADGTISPNAAVSDVDENEGSNVESEYVFEEYLEDGPNPKRIKNSEFNSEQSKEFPIKQEECHQTDKQIAGIYLPSHSNDETAYSFNDHNEALSFGRTIGLQLKELNSLQRIIAEKLMSDTIYLARLSKLTTNASIQLN